MYNNYNYWKNKRILVIGASSDLCSELLDTFVGAFFKVGLHYNKNYEALEKYESKNNVLLIQQSFELESDLNYCVSRFVEWAGGIDFLIIMVGNCKHPLFWKQLCAQDLLDDYYINTVVPFGLATSAVKYMRNNIGGGRIIFTGTASAQNAGGSNSLSYGAAKLALECIMKRMAKDCAQDNILVNMVCPGFIKSKFMKATMKRSDEEIEARAEFVPLKRPGTFKEVAAPYLYLLSEDTSFVTGEVVNVKGGDWI